MNWIHMVYRSETLKIFKNLLYSDLTRWRWKDVCLLDAPPTPKPGGVQQCPRASGWADTMNSSSVCGFLGAWDEAWSLIHELYSLFPPFPIWSASPAWGTTAYLFFPVSTLTFLESIFCFVFLKKWWYHSTALLKKLHWLPITIKAHTP